jgi:hypothetical protein
MTKGRAFLIFAQLAATYLFISSVRVGGALPWWGWAVPLTVLLLIVINAIWFTRFVAWMIFSGAFFALLVVLSAFTLRWRLEDHFSSVPFYRAMGMYACMVYASLGQIKMNAGRS